ncbi:MAG TPA: DinB family protein [Candidatus Binatia bacterium]|nr:DinB family protein [Candidatus Binatia bacterium]
MDRPLASVYPEWAQHAARLRGAVAGLSADELALRAGPDHAAIWLLAAHVASARVYWLCGVFEQPGADRTPFPDPFAEAWDDDESHPRSGAELAWALDSSWAVVRDCLDRWSVEDLDRTALRIRADGVRQVHSRASVLGRISTHDAFHAGEISQLLGVHHLTPIDLWVRDPQVAAREAVDPEA